MRRRELRGGSCRPSEPEAALALLVGPSCLHRVRVRLRAHLLMILRAGAGTWGPTSPKQDPGSGSDPGVGWGGVGALQGRTTGFTSEVAAASGLCSPKTLPAENRARRLQARASEPGLGAGSPHSCSPPLLGSARPAQPRPSPSSVWSRPRSGTGVTWWCRGLRTWSCHCCGSGSALGLQLYMWWGKGWLATARSF